VRNSSCQRITRWLVATTALATLLLVAAGVSAAAPASFKTGVYDPQALAGGTVPWASLPPDIAYGKTRDVGARLVRIPLIWRYVSPGTKPANPADPASYDWGPNVYGPGFNSAVQGALANGLEPLVVVYNAPAWAECDGHGFGTCEGPPSDSGNFKPDPTLLGHLFTALSMKYPQINYFEVWNEPNGRNWLSDTTKANVMSRYRQMVSQARTALKNQDSANKVVAGGLSPIGWFNKGKLVRYTPMQFLKDYLSVSNPTDFDVWGVHPYTLGGPTKRSPTLSRDPSYGNSIWFGDLGEAAGILNGAKRAGKIPTSAQYWIDEFSWDSSPPDSQTCTNPANGDKWGATPMNILTRWTAEADYRAWKAGFSALIWHQLKDNPLDKGMFQGGLFTAGSDFQVGSQKSATQAFRFPFVAFKRPGGVYVWGVRPRGTSGQVVIQKKTSSGWKNVRTLSPNANGIFSKRFSLSITTRGVLRATSTGPTSAGFALRAPTLSRHIFPFGCAQV